MHHPLVMLHTLLLASLASLLFLLLWYHDAYRRLSLEATHAQAQLATLQQALQRSQADSLTLTAKAAKWEAHAHALQAPQAQQQAHLLEQFKALTMEIMDQKGDQLTRQNKGQLEALLHPLGATLQQFTKEVTRTHEEAVARHATLRTEVERMQGANIALHQEAQKLTHAIRGDHQVQGQWGELILERLLERAGLTKGSEYMVQASFTTSEGKRYRPDAIINLPQGKQVIIDAKMSLEACEAYFASQDPNQKKAVAQKVILSLRQHIKSLAAKEYAQHHGGQTVDFVILFMPLEPAFALAMQEAPDILQEASLQNIIITSPTSLLATLRTIAYIWKNERQHKHALEIARLGGAFYDKLATFVAQLKKLGEQLNSATHTHEQTLRLLAEGRGNLISRAERMKALGARASKTLDSL